MSWLSMLRKATIALTRDAHLRAHTRDAHFLQAHTCSRTSKLLHHVCRSRLWYHRSGFRNWQHKNITISVDGFATIENDVFDRQQYWWDPCGAVFVMSYWRHRIWWRLLVLYQRCQIYSQLIIRHTVLSVNRCAIGCYDKKCNSAGEFAQMHYFWWRQMYKSAISFFSIFSDARGQAIGEANIKL